MEKDLIIYDKSIAVLVAPVDVFPLKKGIS